MFGVLKPFLPKRTLKKMVFVGTVDILQSLLNDIDIDNIPIIYGGNM